MQREIEHEAEKEAEREAEREADERYYAELKRYYAEIKREKNDTYAMCSQDLNITTCHYCKKSCVQDLYIKKRGKKEICWVCLPHHSYQNGIVRTNYQEIFEELEHGIWRKKNVMHLERELSDRFVLDLFAGNIDNPEDMAEKIFTFSDKIKEKRRLAINDGEWD